ncbi:uncharacterized protein [Clytia hemisphaerica]|uniref:Metalloendopeptidase n=1 Tax=Clytia hemisphaerica TaxID=252671 RepID=A0A7M6DMN2_9CNID
MKWMSIKELVLFFLLMLFYVEFVASTDESSTQLNQTQKDDLKKIVHPYAEDHAIIDDITHYNQLVAEHTDKEFVSLYRDDDNMAKLKEGDILPDPKDQRKLNTTSKQTNATTVRRGMLSDSTQLWISRVIPYEIYHPGTFLGQSTADVIREVKKAFETITNAAPCLKFRPRSSSDKNWLSIQKKAGCYSEFGRKYWLRKETVLVLGDGCVNQPIILHEILHALGFYHEQARPDRDSYVKINWENINEKFKSNFDRQTAYSLDSQSTAYNTKSIMHYGHRTFSKNGQDTIIDKFDPNNIDLAGDVLSYSDRAELTKRYQCYKDDTDIWSAWADWTSCFDHFVFGCRKERQRFCFVFDSQPEKCKEGNEFGIQAETEKCDEKMCKEEVLAPHWGRWSHYTRCSRDCGEGYHLRSRECDNPPPAKDSGDRCRGIKYETSLCRNKRCSPDYFRYDVDFESGFEPWRMDVKGLNIIPWRISDRGTPNEKTGPEKPFITKHYAFLSGKFEDSNVKYKDGRLISEPIFEFNQTHCVTFYYQLNGRNIKHMDLYIRLIKSGGFKNFWSLKGHQGNSWKRGAFTIDEQKEPYEIIVEGRIGRDPPSDIAIDDIRVEKGSCVKGSNEGSEGCRNHYKMCKWWKQYGECHKNFRWMLKSCCLSCTSMAYCFDIYDYRNKTTKCEEWVKKGECRRNPKWMWKNCCKSCRKCVDYRPSCKYWAKKYCDHPWMKKNCQTSCNICKI